MTLELSQVLAQIDEMGQVLLALNEELGNSSG